MKDEGQKMIEFIACVALFGFGLYLIDRALVPRKKSEEEKHSKQVQCPYCEKWFSKQMAARWHFERCKEYKKANWEYEKE